MLMVFIKLNDSGGKRCKPFKTVGDAVRYCMENIKKISKINKTKISSSDQFSESEILEAVLESYSYAVHSSQSMWKSREVVV